MATTTDTSLQAYSRDIRGKAVESLRRAGYVPGVIYGQGEEARLVSVAAKELEHMYNVAGENRLVEVTIDDESTPVNTLFVDIQTDPLSGRMLHFDLYRVKMDEEIDAEIPVHLEGETPATYNLGGVLVQQLETVEVRSLPNKLPEGFHVDLGTLEDINDAVHVSDLDIPDGVELLTDTEELVVKIDPPRSEEELEELEEAIDEDAETAVASEHGEEEGEEDAEAAAGDEE